MGSVILELGSPSFVGPVTLWGYVMHSAKTPIEFYKFNLIIFFKSIPLVK